MNNMFFFLNSEFLPQKIIDSLCVFNYKTNLSHQNKLSVLSQMHVICTHYDLEHCVRGFQTIKF
jgi:hypothetical protein